MLVPKIDVIFKKIFKVEYKRTLSPEDNYIPTILMHFPSARRGLLWVKNRESGYYYFSYPIAILQGIIALPIVIGGVIVIAYINYFLFSLIGLA
ncbi:MAG: hypothetical protein Q9M91_08090 [Candidatus Dojkabacteria bacterium]|nr:hypothetical protein [Candidatus Dojkabacteria bacterium]